MQQQTEQAARPDGAAQGADENKILIKKSLITCPITKVVYQSREAVKSAQKKEKEKETAETSQPNEAPKKTPSNYAVQSTSCCHTYSKAGIDQQIAENKLSCPITGCDAEVAPRVTEAGVSIPAYQDNKLLDLLITAYHESTPKKDDREVAIPEDFQCGISFETFSISRTGNLLHPLQLPDCAMAISAQSYQGTIAHQRPSIRPECPFDRTSLKGNPPQLNLAVCNVLKGEALNEQEIAALNLSLANLPLSRIIHPDENIGEFGSWLYQQHASLYLAELCIASSIIFQNVLLIIIEYDSIAAGVLRLLANPISIGALTLLAPGGRLRPRSTAYYTGLEFMSYALLAEILTTLVIDLSIEGKPRQGLLAPFSDKMTNNILLIFFGQASILIPCFYLSLLITEGPDHPNPGRTFFNLFVKLPISSLARVGGAVIISTPMTIIFTLLAALINFVGYTPIVLATLLSKISQMGTNEEIANDLMGASKELFIGIFCTAFAFSITLSLMAIFNKDVLGLFFDSFTSRPHLDPKWILPLGALIAAISLPVGSASLACVVPPFIQNGTLTIDKTPCVSSIPYLLEDYGLFNNLKISGIGASFLIFLWFTINKLVDLFFAFYQQRPQAARLSEVVVNPDEDASLLNGGGDDAEVEEIEAENEAGAGDGAGADDVAGTEEGTGDDAITQAGRQNTASARGWGSHWETASSGSSAAQSNGWPGLLRL
jgi:hypothetical protein